MRFGDLKKAEAKEAVAGALSCIRGSPYKEAAKN